MKLSDIVCLSAIIPDLKATDRNGAIRELIRGLDAQGQLGRCDAEKLIKAVIQRENEASTGMGAAASSGVIPLAL